MIGGPHGDTGLTERLLLIHMEVRVHALGGAFPGKDSTKVDRSGAYMARYLAKNMVAAGISEEIQLQIAYAIGMSKPVSVNVNTFGKSNIKLSDSEISNIIINNLI